MAGPQSLLFHRLRKPLLRLKSFQKSPASTPCVESEIDIEFSSRHRIPRRRSSRPEEICTKISVCDALIVRSGTKVNRDVFESSAGRLKVVGRASVGIDNVDLAAATEHGYLVVNAPIANIVAAAEHGIALLTAMSRNIAQADASLKAG